MIKSTQCQVLFRPEDPLLGYLPEAPYPNGDGCFSWVVIQQAADSKCGSLNVFDRNETKNNSYQLAGRPGFAFATDRIDQFVVGLERQVGLFDLTDNSWRPLCDEVETGVLNTIINDGVVCASGIIFGCKDLDFKETKAGLYFLRSSDQKVLQLRQDQVCSNGKVVLSEDDDFVRFLDIDTPTRQVVEYKLNIASGNLSDSVVVLDLADVDAFPDGMIATPDGSGVIIAMYNPHSSTAGEARQYDLKSGQVVASWTTPGSSQVTCPQLVEFDGKVQLLLTTAAENMSPEDLVSAPNAGCLFIGDTEFHRTNHAPVFTIPN